MDKEDVRYQKLEQLHERRKQVVRLHKAGHGVMDIARLTGLSYPTVRRAIATCTTEAVLQRSILHAAAVLRAKGAA